MKKKMRLGALSGAIFLSLLCLSADSSPKSIFRSQSDRIDELEKQNLELKKQIAELNQKIEILTARVNSCTGGQPATNNFTEENISSGPTPAVPGLEVVRIRPGTSSPAVPSSAPSGVGRPKPKGTVTVYRTTDDDSASFASSPASPLPGTNYVPLPDPANPGAPPPVLSYTQAPAAPAAAPAPAGSPALASGEAAAYKQLKEMWDQNQTDLAVPLMQEYLKRHARGAHEDEVAYRLGNHFFDQAEYAKAVSCYRLLRESHYTSNFAPDAIYKLGLCYLKMGMQKEAEEALEEVESIYPFSNAAPLAKKELESCCR